MGKFIKIFRCPFQQDKIVLFVELRAMLLLKMHVNCDEDNICGLCPDVHMHRNLVKVTSKTLQLIFMQMSHDKI